MRHRYAFLPLISDPDGRDKSRLFHDLETETEVELAADAPHPPVFACVMRKQGSHSAHKQLECHGFVCNTSEDAIIIAANLYQVKKEFITLILSHGVFHRMTSCPKGLLSPSLKLVVSIISMSYIALL